MTADEHMHSLSQVIEQWAELDLSGRRAEWDDSYGHIVANKENGVAARQQLVMTVKEFAAAYKADPNSERVEALLRFMKKFINDLYDRILVAEDGFIGLYQRIALIDDPVTALKEAQSLVSEASKKAFDAEMRLNELTEKLSAAERARIDNADESRARTDEIDAVTANILSQQQEHIASLEKDAELLRGEASLLRRQLSHAHAKLAEKEDAAQATSADERINDASNTRRQEQDKMWYSEEEFERQVAAAAQRLSDERSARLRESLARAESEIEQLLTAQRNLDAQLSDEQQRRQSLECALKEAENRRLADAEAHSAMVACARPSTTSTAKPTTTAEPQMTTTLAKRVAELESALRQTSEQLSVAQQRLAEGAAPSVRMAPNFTVDFDDVGGATAEHPGDTAIVDMSTATAGTNSALTPEDFEQLVVGGPLDGGGTGVSSAVGGAEMTRILIRQRDALKRKLADASEKLARQQMNARKLDDRPRCELCELRRGAVAAGGLPSESRRRAAITALDRVGAILGYMLQTSWMARVGVVAYLLTLHCVVFVVMLSWSSASQLNNSRICKGSRLSGA